MRAKCDGTHSRLSSADIYTTAALNDEVICRMTSGAPVPNPGLFTSIQASHEVALESDPASAFWQLATPIYIVNDNFGREVPKHRTEVRSRWTKESLYILFICPYQKLHLKSNPSATKETNLLWNWDVAEIFIGSDFHNIRRYKEFEISP